MLSNWIKTLGIKFRKNSKSGIGSRDQISNVTDFGIFVQLLPGIDGLVHVSDLSWTKHIEHPQQEYKRSDVVDAVILGIDSENKKVSLGIKQLQEDPWDIIAKEYQEGSVITGTISKIADFGAFVVLPVGVEGPYS